VSNNQNCSPVFCRIMAICQLKLATYFSRSELILWLN